MVRVQGSTLGRSSRALAVSRVEDRGQSRKAAHVSYRRMGLLSVKYERADLLCECPLCIQRITSGTPASIAVARPPLRAQAPEKVVVSTPVASRPRTIVHDNAVGPGALDDRVSWCWRDEAVNGNSGRQTAH